MSPSYPETNRADAMKAVIPLAGKGTRLRPHTYLTPKPLLRVGGKPVMSYILDDLQEMGIDAIVEVTETGSSLRANDLRIVDTVCGSTTQFIVNNDAWKNSWKKDKIEQMVMLLRGAILAEGKVGLKMNARKKDLGKILRLLPSMKAPTVSQLADGKWIDIDTVIDEEDVKKLIPKLKKAGGQGIIEYPLNKVIY